MVRPPLLFAVALAVSTVAACGSFGSAPAEPGVVPVAEAGLSDAPSPDAEADSGTATPPPSRACAVGAVFRAPQNVKLPAGYTLESARFAVDQKTAYLSLCDSPLKTSCELYTAPVSSGDGSIGTPTRHPLSQTLTFDSYLSLSPDGNVALFASGRQTAGISVFTATYDPALGTFGKERLLGLPANPSGLAHTNEPYLLRDGKTVYFSAVGTDEDWDIFRGSGAAPAYGAGAAAFTGGLSPKVDVTPVVTEDEQEMFFATDRVGPSLDVWVATKRGPLTEPDPFGLEVPVKQLNTDAVEYPTWISADACTLYFVRKPSQATAGGTLWVTAR